MKKKFLVPVFSLITMLGITVLVYGKSLKDTYTYSNGYEMEYYQVYADSETGAYTYTDDPAVAYVDIFIYNGQKEIVNSDFTEQGYYAYLTVSGQGKYSVSHHSLKSIWKTPYGERRSLDSRYFPN